MTSKNLWPTINIFGDSSQNAPEKILKEQAVFLSQKAPNSIKAKIIQAIPNHVFNHTYSRITVYDKSESYASLDYNPTREKIDISNIKLHFRFIVSAQNVRYDFELLRISYVIGRYYPLTLLDSINDTEYEISNEEIFLETLKKIFNSPKVITTIKNTIIYSGGTEF